jgi:chromosome segregation ATPase
MAVEQLTYEAMAERLGVTREAIRALCKRHHLPRSRANDGRTLIAVDLAELQHKPAHTRSPGGDQEVVTSLQNRISTLEAALAALEITSNGHRADFERERARAELLVGELLKATSDAMAAKNEVMEAKNETMAVRKELTTAREDVARLEGAWAAYNRRPWWKKLVG